MVEGASIDKAAHPNDVTGVMSEMSGFEKAFQNSIDYAKTNKDTLSDCNSRPFYRWYDYC